MTVEDTKSAAATRTRPLSERLEEVVKNPGINKFLGPLAFAYGAGSYLRILSYSKGLARRNKASVPVVSVGNVTVGGTGKTPVVIDLVDRVSSRGVKTAILSRGYGRKSQVRTLLVSDGEGPLVSVEESGDEPYLMARSVPAATVMVGAKRVETAGLVTRNHGAGMIFLDDGFQHVQLRRDLDIVLFDYNDDPDCITLLPQGRLREPLSALGRADIIVVTKIPVPVTAAVKEKLKTLSARLRHVAPRAVLQYASFVPSYLLGHQDAPDSRVAALADLAGKKILALCGIARPEGFFNSLSALGATVVDKMVYADHHWFDAGDLAAIEERFARSSAEYLVTTEKDMVRLHLTAALGAKTFALMQSPLWLNESGQVEEEPYILKVLEEMAGAPQ
ncbi:MAG: tetraacyldisaccharide 4'-kinase [Cyanobacteria bacterium SZAS LIN-2]|nr:tetraacyldisaccharide 4'-kinase [Cyanobacteria bacterium SZAS LIN-2]